MPVNSQQHTADNLAATPAEEGFLNVSGYRFVELENLKELQAFMHADFSVIGIKGTVLLRFKNLWLKESRSDFRPFSKLKVKIRPEIITFEPDLPEDDSAEAQTAGALDTPWPTKSPPTISPLRTPAPSMAPGQLKEWLDKDKAFTLLDARNQYEIESGGFDKAVNLGLVTFKNFQNAVQDALEDGSLNKEEPVVTFCTGGIRCEKAAPYLLQQGFKEVYQVEGGILNYFEECGGAHWQGDCFVFDDRIEITPQLEPTGSDICRRCHRAMPDATKCTCTSDTST